MNSSGLEPSSTTVPDIYQPAFVMRLFDEMSRSYGIVNYVASFGFAERWRRQCASKLKLPAGAFVLDLMSGMGELWPSLFKRKNGNIKVAAVELSHEMCKRSTQNTHRYQVSVLQADALALPIADGSVDAVVSAFGLKTFCPAQKQQLAREIARVLKPDGQFSLIEISLPKSTLLRLPYMFYVNSVIPLVGRLFMGNPDNYRMLGVYTERFGNSATTCQYLHEAGLEARFESYFFGCATGVSGRKR